jgi:hypothetical protein
MAIQLSDRDTLIFKYIEEHKVLLEKHISWFISADDKPVLIRDRLRKLFYLDYLLCQRHDGKLPWWTTPTKPLVYMLSPMTQDLLNIEYNQVDLSNPDIQRHLLEIANIRMLMLVDEKAGFLKNFAWSTEHAHKNNLDALLSFETETQKYSIGIINNQNKDHKEIEQNISKNLSDKTIETVWLISRDEITQNNLQKAFSNSSYANSISFATHHEIYQSGVIKAKWQNTSGQINLLCHETVNTTVNLHPNLSPAV